MAAIGSPSTRAMRRCPAIFLACAAALLLAGCAGGEGPSAPGRADCASPGTLADRDDAFGRLFADVEACVTTETFREAGETWTLQLVDSGRPGPLWVLPHDDEDAALSTAAFALSRYGGTVVAVETGGRRLNGRIDPNRAFSSRASACEGAAPRYTRAVLSRRNRRFPVVALHTNGPRTAARGGSGGISILSPPDGASAVRPPAGAPRLGGEDDLVIVASRAGEGDRRLMADVRALNAAGIYVLVETVSADRNDCSLSHHAALAGISPYFNVEVRHGNAALQKRMVSIVMEVAGVSPRPGA